ncbi:MAG: endonuclease/exonuclease/phosphatase family protein [Candidatus Promineifilaceae bacterium]
MLKRFSYLLIAGLFLSTLLGFFGRFHWLFDLFAHFRVQYIAIASLFALFALLHKPRYPLYACLLILLINLAQIAPYYYPAAQTIPNDSTTTLRVMSTNVNSAVGNEQSSIDSILATEADIVAIIELNPLLAEQLSTIQHIYPHQQLQTMENSHFGIGLLSKYPLSNQDVLWLDSNPSPSLYAEITTQAGPVAILASHPSPPLFRYGTDLRTMRFQAIEKFMSATAVPTIVLGDLNATPWSHDMRSLVNNTRLHDSALGHGLQPTWLSRQHLLGIPIDYVLVSAEFSTLDHQVLPRAGSDHLPIVATLQLHQ